jgi:hypothetical protein
LKKSEKFLVKADKLLADVKSLMKVSELSLDANASVLEEGEGKIVEVEPVGKDLLALSVSALETAVREALASAPKLNEAIEDEQEEDADEEEEEEDKPLVKNKT